MRKRKIKKRVTALSVLNKVEFLFELLSHHKQEGYACLSFKRGNRWKERYVRTGPRFTLDAVKLLKRYPDDKYDQYFSVNLFSRKERKKSYALPSAIAHVDIDDSDVASYRPKPSILIESSQGRYHGYWLLDRPLPAEKVERISKYLTYAHCGDHGGWSVTKVLRIPGTINHKPEREGFRVRIVRNKGKIHPSMPLLRKSRGLRMPAHSVFHADEAIAAVERGLKLNQNKLKVKARKNLRHTKARAILMHDCHMDADRSRAIWILMGALRKAGFGWHEIACLVWHSYPFHQRHGTYKPALIGEIERGMLKIDGDVGL